MRNAIGTTVMLGTALASGGVRFERGENDLHQAASQTGAECWRGTPAGHCAFAGQLAANHAMIESYFRAVKDAPPSRRSKKRQSPVARRDTVTDFMPRARPNSSAQEIR
jgi:hypothetical protein